MRAFARLFSVVSLLGAAACSGQGGNVVATTPVAAPLPAPKAPQSTSVEFRIVVPPAATNTNSRRPRYVSVATKSATIAVSPGSAAPVVVNCTTVCQGQIAAPIGTDTFAVKLYDASGGSGNLLSTGTSTFTVVIDQTNAINLTFNGVVSSVAVVLYPATATYGTPETGNVTVNALDADGNTIVAPGVYVDANGKPVTIALTNSDTSGHTTLSANQVAQPTTGITLAYDGNSYVSPTISAAATGLQPAAGTLAVRCRPPASTEALYTDGFSQTGAQTLDRYPIGASGDNVAPSAVAALNIFSTAYATGLALDAAGTLYANSLVQVAPSPAAYKIVVDTWCADVTGSPPPRTAFVEADNADGTIALDGSANLYGTSFNASDNSFSVYELAANSGGPASSVTSTSTPTPTIRNFVATPPIKYRLFPSLAVDPPGNVYAAADTVVNEYAAAPGGANPAPLRSITSLAGTGLITPISTAVDPAGNVYVLYLNDMRTTFPGGYAIAEFSAGTMNAPSRVIEGPATQIGTYFGNPSGTVNPTAVAIAVDATGNIFVLNSAAKQNANQFIGEGSVQEFGNTQNGNVAPLTTIDLTGSAVLPNDIALDAADNVYVSDGGSFVSGGSWYEYTQAGVRVRTLAGNAPDGSSDYENIAVDATGNVAVTDYDGASSGNVYFFGTSQTGNSAPVRTLAISNVLFAKKLAFDASANLYLLTSENQFNTIFISPFSFRGMPPERVALARKAIVAQAPSRGRPLGLSSALAARRDRHAQRTPQFAFPQSEGGPTPPYPMVSVYAFNASGSATPTRTFTDVFTFDSEGDSMAVTGTGTAYVASRFGNAIYAYAPTASGPNVSPTLAYGTFGPSTAFAQLGTDTAGTLYEISSVSNAISVFAPGATTPQRVIVGPHTLISSPSQPLIDSAGEILLLDYDLNAVLVFGASQSGDVAPLRVLSQSDVASRVLNQIAIGPGTVSASTSGNARAKRR